MIINKVEYVVW